ncbi:MAG: glycosyltransferase family A protein [Intestinibacter bartlettii]|uniref:glycosyltransferase family 2 protein n=1 Tax=Intestinibacter bartlettii TaxID=261299 RepID=UPI0026EB2994|nr:glycosyltransferase family A protein [Intestinibacter bartlettii]MDO5010178.1 glycosyltransferase family A protein [Intestinibacter bartlettii]
MKEILPIDIIIPTMNRIIALRRTLDRITKSDKYPNKVIIVDQTQDNKKRQEISNMLRDEFEILNIEYIFQKNPSLTKARNIGFKASESEIIICMDDDVDVENNTISNVYEIMKNSKISMIAGIDKNDINEDKKINIASNMGYVFYKKSFLKRNIGHVTKSTFGRFPVNFEGNIHTEWAMGFFFVIRKPLVEVWNLQWDEKLISYAYAEDLDFSYQYYLNSKKNGYSCIMSDKVIVTHLATREWRISSKKETFMLIINRLYLNYKLFKSPFARLSYEWSNIGILLERVLHKDNYKDFLDLWYISYKYRKQIKSGEIPYYLID